MLLGLSWGAHDARIQQFADRLLVRPIRRGEGNRHGDAGGVGEMMAMALGAALGAVGGIGAGFFPHPAGLCATTHRRTATATRAPRPDHSTAGAAARALPRCPARPSAGTAGAAWSRAHTPAARPSTGSPCAGRRARRPASGVAAPMGGHRSAETLRSETGSRSGSTTHREPSTPWAVPRGRRGRRRLLSAITTPPRRRAPRRWRSRTTRRKSDPVLNHLRDRLLVRQA
jgi:hypothetical protein